MAFGSVKEILEKCTKDNIEFWQAVIHDDITERGTTEEESFEKMRIMWEAMVSSADDYEPDIKSNSSLVGGMGGKFEKYSEKGESYCGDFVGEVIKYALEMGENNACMKRIVAAPTAGACGVMPAVLIPVFKRNMADEDKIIKALFTAAGIGQVIAERAFIAGASGGCQAEIGSASAMAAAALTFIKGGSNEEITFASAMALQNLLGLVCDPVAGLVEVPCVKRNVIGAMNALSCADMALAGIGNVIPLDEVIDAMREVGESMNVNLKETGCGGCANTPTGIRIKKELMGEE